MINNWKNEASRDLMALGSIPFVLLVLIRVLIAGNFLQFFQIIFGAVLIFVISAVFKKSDNYSAIMIVLASFTALFYMDRNYTIFVIVFSLIAFFGMYKYLGRKNVWYGVFVGAVCSLISYFVSNYLPLQNY